MVKHESDFQYVRPTKFDHYSLWLAPSLVFIGAFSLYIKTLAPSIFWGDSAAFAASNYILGIPHSPSFPLYTLIGRLFSLLPGVTPAFASNLMSAFFAALAMTFFYLVLRQLLNVPVFLPEEYKKVLVNQKAALENPDLKSDQLRTNYEPMPRPTFVLIVGLTATALFTVSLPVWLSAVRAEVYSLHMCLTFGAMFLCLKGKNDEMKRFFFAGIWLYALSFANHPLLALAFAPAFLWLILANLSGSSWKIRTIAISGLFFVIAFSVYFYLPVRAAFEPAINWGRPDNLESFWAAITRSGDMANFSAMLTAPDYLLRSKKIGDFLVGQVGWPSIGFCLLGFIGLFKISKKSAPFFPLAMIFNAAIVLWAADFDQKNYDLINYLAPLTGLILIVGAAGVMGLMRFKFPIKFSSVAIAVLFAGLTAAAIEDNYAKADLSDVNGPEIISEEVLKDIPPGSIILTAEDNFLLPLWYAAYVNSMADQISILSPGAMGNQAYRKQLTINYPDLIYPKHFYGTEDVTPGELATEICQLNAGEHDIYVQFGVPGISHEEIVPDGILFKYIGKDKKVEIDPDFYRQHISLVEEMLEGNPDDAGSADFCGRWLFTIGVYCDRKGLSQTAWQLFDAALAIDKENIDMRIRLASALARAKLYTEALKYVHQALEIDSQDPNALKLGQHIVQALERQKAVATK